MNRRALPRTLTIGIALAVISLVPMTAVRAQQPWLTPAGARTTDASIARDQATLARWRQRVDALPQSGAVELRYQRTKAAAWMAFVESEYADNERGPVIEAALHRVSALVVATEQGETVPGYEEPLPGTVRAYPEYFDHLRAHVRHGRMACAPEALAEMEVQLTVAAHAPGALGRMNAQAALARAAALDAQLNGASCETPAPAEPSAPVEPPAPAPVTVTDSVTPPPTDIAPVREIPVMPGSVHFGFARSRLSAATRRLLARVLVVAEDGTVVRIELVGHTDRHGSARVNARLARRRASAVRRYLLDAGLTGVRVTISVAGSREPQDSARTPRADARNRRVELRLFRADGTAMPFRTDDSDLQLRRR